MNKVIPLLLFPVLLAACLAPDPRPAESPLIPNEVSMRLEQEQTNVTPAPGDEQNNPMVAAYVDAMQIDYAEAENRLALQQEMSLIEQEIAQDEAYFASWIVHEPEFGLVVSFTAPDGDERMRKYLKGVEWADLVTVQQSDITRDELNEIRDTVVQEAEETGFEFGTGLNYRTGKVRVYTDEIDALRESFENNEVIAPLLDRLEFIQEGGVAPAD